MSLELGQNKGMNKGTHKKTLKRPQNESKVTFQELEGAEVIESNDSLTTNNLFRLADLHFNKKNYMFRHLYDSYNKFIEEDIKNFLEHTNHVFSETLTPTTSYVYWFKYANVRIEEPLMPNGVEPLFPSDVRHNRLTYSVKLFANVTQYQDVIDIASGYKVTNIVGTTASNYHIGTIPLMVRSKWCSTINHKDTVRNECEYDPGGYFIVGGNEKVVISQDRMVDNKPLVFIKKDSGALSYVVQINSRSYKFNGMSQVMNVKLRKDGVMMIRVPILTEVNVCAVLRALGMDSDKQIIDYITYDSNDSDMTDLIRLTLDACKNEKGSKISTQEEAIDFLLPKIKAPKKYTDSDRETKQHQKKMYLDDLFKKSFLPHVEGSKLMKAYYLCYMLNRLLRIALGRIPVDDRDSYLNKRVDLPGDLLMELFKQQHKKVISDCKNQYEHKNKNDAKPINIISYIKAGTVEQGFKAALSTGRWPRRQGVAQVLNRLSYLQTISFLRRVDAPGGDASSVKLTNPRHLHASSVGFLCCVTGDTKVLMSDCQELMIKNINNGDSIVTFDRESLFESTTTIKNYFQLMPDKLLQISTISGRTIKCTPDHPFLVRVNNNNVMINACDLKVGNTVICLVTSTNDEFFNYQYYQSEILERDYNLTFEDFCSMELAQNLLAVAIESIEEIEPELVYDFETVSDTHTLIANGFVTSNCSQTPEHAKVGLTKHLTLIGSLSIMSRDQFAILHDYLVKHTTHLLETPPAKLQDVNTYKVFLNGDWIGVTDKFIELSNELQRMKLYNEFDHKNVSIVTDHDECEIRVYCDSGRMYRPAFVVKDNKLLITKEDIDAISLNKSDQLKKITDFDEFVIKKPGLIEYIDMELQPHVMIADKEKSLNIMLHKMNNSIELSKNVKSRHVDNRYDDMFYAKYSHCEIHPSLLIGEIIANIPFFDHNVGPRVIFAYAQGRQAMGIYATNYRDRMDISYILYHPQRPLVSTRTARYTNSELLPAGENCVVAIACYTGYNQEDSLIFNKTSIERGKFRGMYLKKYLVQVQKNQTTFQDDLLIKPDPNKTSNMKNSNVDKLNEKGYAPEETKLEFGDVIFGKVTQVTDPNAKKPYRDSSEIYKMHTPGVVDRMYIDIPNADGYLTREALIRCEKYPRIGDKYSSRHGQKGTIGILLDAIDMPFTKDGMVPDLIVNPNAIPSRMTIGQLVEGLVGKCAALQGMDADGTVFEEHNFETAKDTLEKLGYDRNGYEYMYNGMTGEKMLTKIFLCPTFYQRLKHLVEDKIHCILSSTHEVLTFSGWKFEKDLTMDDKIACLEHGNLVYANPIAILRYPNYKGRMYHIQTQQIELCVTMNHRMWTSKVYSRKKVWLEHDFELAEDIVGKHRKYKKDATWEQDDYQFYLEEMICDNGKVYDKKAVDMDAWLKFIGLWIAEGCAVDTEKSNEACRYVTLLCIHKPRIQKVIDQIMKKLELNYDVHNNILRITNKQLWAYMATLSVGAPFKQLPDWVWELSQRQSRILLEHLIMGDGSYHSSSERYYTSSVKLADDVMRLALHCGWSANKWLHCKAGHETEIEGRKVVSNYDVWRLGIVKNKNTPEVNHGHVSKQGGQVEEIIEDFEGAVFCLQVPSEVFMVRCGGKAVWTANSRARGAVTALTRRVFLLSLSHMINIWLVTAWWQHIQIAGTS